MRSKLSRNRKSVKKQEKKKSVGFCICKWDKVVCNIWLGGTALGFAEPENVRSTFGNRSPSLSPPPCRYSSHQIIVTGKLILKVPEFAL